MRENVGKLYDNAPAKGGIKPVAAPAAPAPAAGQLELDAKPAPKGSAKTTIDITVDD